MPKLSDYIPGLLGGEVDIDVGVDLGDIVDSNLNELLEFDQVASAVNHIRILNAITAENPAVKAVGDDTNVGLNLTSKGTGSVTLWSGDVARQLAIFLNVASAVNEFSISPAITAGNPILAATGDNTNIGILLQPKGTGAVVADAPAGLGVGAFESASTVDSTAGVVTYTIAQLKSGFIERDPNGASRSDVTPTAANIVAGLPNVPANSSFLVIIKNTADAAEVVTLTAGTGVTLTGDMAIGQNELKMFLVRLTNVTAAAEAVTFFGLGSVLHNT